VTKIQTNSFAVHWQVVKQQQKLGTGPQCTQTKQKTHKQTTFPLDLLNNLLLRFLKHT